MKKTLILLLAALSSIVAFSQQYACKQDTFKFYQDGYRGKLTWQVSDNGADWSALPGNPGDTLMVIANHPVFYRTEVIEGFCQPYYSDAIQIIVNDIPPIKLQLVDSICQSEPAIMLDGGYPSGGVYWGTGVTDGRFIPAMAGTGSHIIHYSYKDPVTGCGDSTQAMITVLPATGIANAGNDFAMIPADSVLLDAAVPEGGTGTWSVVEGSSGRFSDIHSAKSWFIKDAGSLDYVLNWTVTGACGTSSDQISLTFFPLSKNPCPNAPTVTDADGNVYPTVLIGTQCWMAKNLNVGQYVPSTIRTADHSDLRNNGIIEKYCLHNNPDSCKLYGGLYDWDEAMGYTNIEGAQGICPVGWHIPTYADWNTLDRLYAWGDAGKQTKIGGDSGFDGHLAGDRHAQGEFFSNGSAGFFWVSQSFIFEDYNDGYVRLIEACNDLISTNHFNKKTGVSVRCIKNSN